MRDIAELLPDLLHPGRAFRSSQFHTSESRHNSGIKSVLDLRQQNKLCKKSSRVMLEVVRADWWLYRLGNYGGRCTGGVPNCPNCESTLNVGDKGPYTRVYHLDFCTPRFKFKLVRSVPFQTVFSAVSGALTCRNSAEAVMSDAVADNDKLGYGKLYILFLEKSKVQIAHAFRLLEDPDNYPVLINCIHGKDRTGILVMLLLRLCGASYETIYTDYMASARCMLEWQEHDDWGTLEAHLRTKEILSVERMYMMKAVEHITQKYGDVDAYLLTCGVSAASQAAVRRNMRLETDAESVS